MSKLTYLASSIKLSEGNFISKPDLIYCNYKEYRNSDNYSKPKEIHVSPPLEFKRNYYNLDIPVYVYKEAIKGGVNISLHNDSYATVLLPDVSRKTVHLDIIKESIKNQYVDHHFSLPYIYYLGIWSGLCKFLLDFLCCTLCVGEKAEIYSCWSETEFEPRKREDDLFIDLNDYLRDSTLIEKYKYIEEHEKVFISLSACDLKPEVNYTKRASSIIIEKGTEQEFFPRDLDIILNRK